MKIAFVGLGRMGKNMVLRLLKKGQKVVVWNRSPGPVEEVVSKGAIPAKDTKDLVKKLTKPRLIWLMLPAGRVTESYIKDIVPLLNKGDILIDGGNSNFKVSKKRYSQLKAKGIKFLDVGTSGGIVAAKKGYCMMVGGDKDAYSKVEPFIKDMCTKDGYGLMGTGGAGHYVKMIHNAIEYGMMHSIAEGFDLLENGSYQNLDMLDITKVWNHGSIVSSFLMEMAQLAFEKDKNLSYLKPFVEDNGEGRWAAIEALDNNVPFNVNTYALFARYHSRDSNSMAYRMLAALRNEFGGHKIKK